MNRKSKTIIGFILILFLIVSVFLMIPQGSLPKHQIRKKSLNKKITKDGNTERTDYLDENGVITLAADLGYATAISIKTNIGKTIYYYDEFGEPISQYPGYYAIRREYDENGRNNHITYLGPDDLPVVTAEGYSDIKWTFYDTGKIKTEKYYNPSGKPTNTHTYGYGYLNEYNEKGENIKTTYLDENDNPMMVDLGYASVKRVFLYSDDNNDIKSKKEYYLDEHDNPQIQSMGYYGIQSEYDNNGCVSVLTYLDLNGNPTTINKGYTSIVRTYNADNTIATERYYDIDGNPYSLSEGQYGVKSIDDKIVYLNKNGDETFNIKRFLYNRQWIVIPCALLAVTLSLILSIQKNYVLLVLYSIAIIYLTLMYRESTNTDNYGFFVNYLRFAQDRSSRVEILNNIWLFIPLGAILYKLFPKATVLIVPVFISILIEVIQYYFKLGYCDPGDIISNSLGSVIGFVSAKIIKKSLAFDTTQRNNKP